MSVRENLPPLGDIVLIYTPNAPKKHNYFRTAWQETTGGYWRVCGSGAFVMHENVTHWMRFERPI